jgi:chorismate mutase
MSLLSGKSPTPEASQADTQQMPAVSTPSAAIVPVGGLASTRPGIDGSMAELRRRRYELAERVAELTWDLGGLTYEMAIRDHYRLDVLARRAAELQQADAQLAEVQRLLSGAEAGVHGQCRSCGAVHSRGASFCWHCGAGLLEEARPTVLEGEPKGSTPSTG